MTMLIEGMSEETKKGESNMSHESKLSQLETLPHSRLVSLLVSYQRKTREQRKAIVQLKLEKDEQLQVVIGQLLHLEGRLRLEQKDISGHLTQRDEIISSQRQEIERLRRENRRLINQLKKPSGEIENDETTTEPPVKFGRDEKFGEARGSNEMNGGNTGFIEGESHMGTKRRVEGSNDRIEKHSKLTAFPKPMERITHKPPIAEKPRVAGRPNRTVTGQILSTVSSVGGRQCCSIVSTIGRLLDEPETDSSTTASSSDGSEPSSPEATLKPSTPRVIRLARRYEGLAVAVPSCGLAQVDEAISPDATDSHMKAYILDEYEVTSGYNSDALSEPDYENIDNLSPIFAPTVNDSSDMSRRDRHIYSNIDFRSEEILEMDELLETDLDTLDTVNIKSNVENVRMNVPRCRHNINHLMESDDHMTQNFEEFTFDSLELEDGELKGDGSNVTKKGHDKENHKPENNEERHRGDGAETEGKQAAVRVTSDTNSTEIMNGTITNGQYEKFLEATGLSQKSILTPSRLFSNHRSVLKPRDVKHRHKLRAAFTTLTTLEEVPSACSQKYWTEPYL